MKNITDYTNLSLDEFITKFSPREERHYCAYLFSWLLTSPENIRIFIQNHTGDLFSKLDKSDIQNSQIYFEYTAIRELLDLISRKAGQGGQIKETLKQEIESHIFEEQIGDIQKKKPDLAFYFPGSKSLLLVEAKFELGFDQEQINQSEKYGNVLRELFPDQIKNVHVSVLGLNYYTEKIKNIYPAISWETIYILITEGKVKSEIKKGLDYQKSIHPRSMLNWQI